MKPANQRPTPETSIGMRQKDQQAQNHAQCQISDQTFNLRKTTRLEGTAQAYVELERQEITTATNSLETWHVAYVLTRLLWRCSCSST
jgi:hypothetical protein